MWGTGTGLRPWPQKLSKNRVGTTWTDAVVGQIGVRNGTKRGLALLNGVTQFDLIESKITAPLSAGTSNADSFDQAARNVICMVVELREHGILPRQLESGGFHVVATEKFSNVHRALVTRENVTVKFAARREQLVEELPADEVSEFEDFETNYLNPLLERMALNCITWEQVVKNIECVPEEGDWLNAYYQRTLEFAG